ncbi:NHLP leader peptide family RiPP precursor [Roseovarius aestuarii]|nr:NHLP leader peptide family RiPP precursor [Roseovarius aestuarii]
MSTVQFQDYYGQVVARAWTDPDFKARLKTEPRAALAEMGLGYPEDVRLELHENEPEVMHLVIPPQPSEDELSVMEIDKIKDGTVVPCYIIPTKGRWQLMK